MRPAVALVALVLTFVEIFLLESNIEPAPLQALCILAFALGVYVLGSFIAKAESLEEQLAKMPPEGRKEAIAFWAIK